MFNRLLSFFTPKSTPPRAVRHAAASSRLPSGLVQRPTDINPLHRAALQWLGANTPSRLQTIDLVRQIVLQNGDISHAKDTIVSHANTGYDLTVYRRSSASTPAIHSEGLALVQSFAARMLAEYGGGLMNSDGVGNGVTNEYSGLNRFVDMVHRTLYVDGAVAVEIALSDDLKTVQDVYLVDVKEVQAAQDDRRVWRYGTPLGTFTEYNPFQFRYVALDPTPDNPLGTPPLASAIQASAWQQETIKSIQQILYTTGNSRLDVNISAEAAQSFISSINAEAATDTVAMSEALNDLVNSVKSSVEGLTPSDAFVHFDSTAVNYITPGSSPMPIDRIMAIIDTQIVSAARVLPLFLGRNEGATTTHASLQYRAFADYLGQYRRISAELATWVFNTVLRLQGIDAYAVLTYRPDKTSDELIDAQAEAIRTNTAITQVQAGFITQDEAANQLAGHDAVNAPLAPAASTLAQDKPMMTMREHGVNFTHDAIQDRISELPSYLKRAVNRTRDLYHEWHETAAFYRLEQIDTTNAPTTPAALESWFMSKIAVDDADRRVLQEYLIGANQNAMNVTLQKHLRDLGVNGASGYTVSAFDLMQESGNNAFQSASSIVNTYNNEMRNHLRLLLQDDSRTPDQVVAAMKSYSKSRNAYKSRQIGLTETMNHNALVTREFDIRNRDVSELQTAEVIVVPPTAAEPECAGYLAGNPYPNMRSALLATTLPAHFNCPHSLIYRNPPRLGADALKWTGA